MLQFFSRWRGSRSVPERIKAGDRYCRILGHRHLETATIIDLRRDLVGIPHVHFSVAYERSDADLLDGGPRTLALSRFLDEYRRQAPATPRTRAKSNESVGDDQRAPSNIGLSNAASEATT